MKRQALGKGLGALIPDGGGTELLPKSGVKVRPEARSPGKEARPNDEVSAADMASIPETDVDSSTPRGSRMGSAGASGSQERPETAKRPSDTSRESGAEQEEDAAARDPRSTASAREASPRPEQADRVPGDVALQWLDIDRIKPNPLQPRRQFHAEQIEELAASIRASGVLQPLIVRRIDGGYGLIAGERRWRAAQKAGLRKVPALIREAADAQLLQIALVENLQRQDLNPIEEARAYSSLMKDFGLTQGEVAERVGRQRPSVANSLRLLSLPASVQDLVETGALSMGHARALAGLPPGKAQEIAAGLVIDRGFSVRETETWVARHTTAPPEPTGAPRVDPNVKAAAENLQRRLGTKVSIRTGRGDRGLIVIQYFSTAELDRLYLRLSKI